MAISPRCSNNGAPFGPSFSVALTGWANAGAGVSGTAPAAGDIVFIVGTAAAASQTVTQTAGTGNWTFQSSGDNDSSGTVTTFAAWRVFDGTETAPTFHLSGGGTVQVLYAVQAVTPDAGWAVSVDTWAAVLIDTAATTHTANTATASGTDLSLILDGAVASVNGGTSITHAAPPGWTFPSGSAQSGGGSAGNPQYAAGICYQTVSGTVAPGAETIRQGAAGTTFANVYHVLIGETGGPPQPTIPSQAVISSQWW